MKKAGKNIHQLGMVSYLRDCIQVGCKVLIILRCVTVSNNVGIYVIFDKENNLKTENRQFLQGFF